MKRTFFLPKWQLLSKADLPSPLETLAEQNDKLVENISEWGEMESRMTRDMDDTIDRGRTILSDMRDSTA